MLDSDSEKQVRLVNDLDGDDIVDSPRLKIVVVGDQSRYFIEFENVSNLTVGNPLAMYSNTFMGEK